MLMDPKPVSYCARASACVTFPTLTTGSRWVVYRYPAPRDNTNMCIVDHTHSAGHLNFSNVYISFITLSWPQYHYAVLDCKAKQSLPIKTATSFFYEFKIQAINLSNCNIVDCYIPWIHRVCPCIATLGDHEMDYNNLCR